MDWKVSFFVKTAARTASGWAIHGEPGIGRPEPGDRLVALVHEAQGREDPVALVVESCSEDELRVNGSLDAAIGPGDILVGTATR
jgi:hypothetical protein